MLKNTLKIILLWAIHLIALILSLILMYASPDNVAHTFEAGIFYVAGAVGVFSLVVNLSFVEEENSLMKLLYALTLVQYILESLSLALICLYAHPMGEVQDVAAAYVFGFSLLLIAIGLLVVLMKEKGVPHA